MHFMLEPPEHADSKYILCKYNKSKKYSGPTGLKIFWTNKFNDYTAGKVSSDQAESVQSAEAYTQ